MIICRVSGKEPEKAEHLIGTLDSLGLDFDRQSFGSGGMELWLFAIKSSNKNDIPRISRSSGIPVSEFLFM